MSEPQNPMAATPAEPRRGLSTKALVYLVTFVSVIALSLAGWAAVRQFGKGGFMRPGQCVQITRDSQGIEQWQLSGCSSSGLAPYRVATVGDGSPACPTVDYRIFTREPTAQDSTRRYACLIPELAVDRCYGEGVNKHDIAVVACTDLKALLRVTSVVARANGGCPVGEEALSYPEPATTYCLGRAR